MKSEPVRYISVLGMLLIFIVALQGTLAERSQASILQKDLCEQEKFRQQHLTPEIYEKIVKAARYSDFSDVLTTTMLQGRLKPDKVREDPKVYQKYKPEEYKLIKRCYQAVWSDIEYFPIPAKKVFFQDTFGQPREYGGNRTHEGCDLFGERQDVGYYPVLSMTDGVVEKKGWLPLGGYRIGIRAPHGGYFYYAHLSGYEKDFREGEEVDAGDILGYMGNTGYGEEGTTGMFPVHLHLGIYIRTPHYDELSVDPYWVLKANSKKIRNCSY
ncbi:MAG: M23 family metallopeptidase [Blautia sp.]|nr:M23 family metallopeptidase [Clostridia bacterium]MDY4692493.1 M23 family metallopeptidase [Blautia sp.]MDY5554058.1 M23 family metallopeptidase [Blautia sp.]